MSQRNRRRTKKVNRNNNNTNRNHNNKPKNNKCPFKCDCKHCNEYVIACKEYIIDNIYNKSPYRLRNFHFAVDLILFIFGALYVVFVPYTKVEESFNMQATHDMLFYGYLDIEKYDHYEFPGVVPRTFIGAFFLSLMVYPWKFITLYILPLIFSYFTTITTHQIHLQQQCQYLIRFALLFINIIALSKFRQSFIMSYFVHHQTDIYKQVTHNRAYNQSKKHNKISMIQRFSLLFSTLILAQFHFLFYSSRLLPNCLALPCITIAFANYFKKQYKFTLIWLALSTVIFRCDTIVIAIPFIVIIIIFKMEKSFHNLSQFVMYGMIASLCCIIFTIFIDSWFWTGFKCIKWPEFEVFWYNSYNNKSSDWGISPWTYYFFPLIPKLLLINTFFMLFSVCKIYPMLFLYELANRYSPFKIVRQYVTDNKDNKDNKQKEIEFEYSSDMSLWRLILLFIDWESVYLLLICFFFVFLYSFLPHKEIRFIFFIISPCTLLSTIGCIRLFTLWGFTSVNYNNHNLYWFKHNLYQRQKELFFLWIPNNLLISCIVKKLVSLETPISVISLRRYFKTIFKEIPRLIFNNSHIKIKIIPLLMSISITISICAAWYGVYEASYNYPGGVAITLFPNIVKNYKTNISTTDSNDRYNNYNYNYYAYRKQEENEKENIQVVKAHIQTKPSRKKRRVRIHSRRGHRMNRDYKTIMNASIDDHDDGKGENDIILLQNESNGENEILSRYDDINCVHIGNLAATSGVTRFLTPSFYSQFRFSKVEQIEIDQYARLKDPCNLYQEMYSKICHLNGTNIHIINGNNNNKNNNNWNDDIYDEEYFEKHDDYLNENEENDTNTEINCYSSIDYKYPTIEGFDYLITEYSTVPGYHLMPNGIIYAKSLNINLMNYLFSFFKHTKQQFLEPKLYVLKRRKDEKFNL